MKIRSFRLRAVFVALCSTFFCAISCECPVPDGSGKEQAIEPENHIQPTEDQFDVKLTADIPTAVLSRFADGTTGAAFVKRLGTATAAVEDNTMMALIN